MWLAYWQAMMRGVLLTMWGLGLWACAPPSTGSTEAEASAPIIGGMLETGHPAAGYLVDTRDPGYARCTLTLIGRRLAVTAAHCVYADAKAHTLAVGFGTFRSDAPRIAVRRAVRLTEFDSSALQHPERALHDVAALILDEAPAITPEPVTAASLGQALTMLGYGVTAPDQPVDASRSLRKSLPVTVDALEDERILVHAKSGGNCYGDSGGPGFNTAGIVGVLSHGDAAFEDCHPGEQTTLTSLSAPLERDFLACALEHQDEPVSAVRYPSLFCAWSAPFFEGMAERSALQNGDFLARDPLIGVDLAVRLGRALALDAGPPGTSAYDEELRLTAGVRAAGFDLDPSLDLVPVTRATALTALAHLLALPPSEGLHHLDRLVDAAPLPADQRAAIDAAAGAGLLVSAFAPNTLRPDDPIRADEWQAMLYQVLVLRGERPALSSPKLFVPR